MIPLRVGGFVRCNVDRSRYLIVDIHWSPTSTGTHYPKRLLLKGEDGFMFPFAAHRLKGAVWTALPPVRQRPRRDRSFR